MAVCIAGLLAAAMAGLSHAQLTGEPVWRILTRADGLPSNDVRDAVADQHGNVWFATSVGVSRFDGLWQTFTRVDGIPSNDVRALATDGPERIWAATAAGVASIGRVGPGQWAVVSDIAPGLAVETFDVEPALDGDAVVLWAGTRSGLARRDTAGWELYPFTRDIPVRALARDSDGHLWCGRDGVDGPPVLLRVDAFAAPPPQFPLPADASLLRIHALLPVGTAQWWVGTSGGILFFDGTWSGPLGPLGSPAIFDFTEDESGAIWTATSVGLARFDGAWRVFGQTAGLPTDGVQTTLADLDGRVWAGTVAGVALTDGSWTRLTTADGLPTNEVTTLEPDFDGALWVGTPEGLARLDAVGVQVFTVTDGLPGNNIRALADDPVSSVWVGAAVGEAGLGRPTATGWTRLRASDGIGLSDDVFSLAVDPTGDIWAGTGFLRTSDGLITFDELGSAARYDGTEWRSWPTGATPVAFARDGDGVVWAGTLSRGLLRFTGFAFEPERLPLPVEVRALHAEANGILWVGTSDGLYMRDGEAWREFGVADGLPGSSVRTVRTDNAGRLWVGMDAGAARREEDGQWVRFTADDGLPQLGVHSIAETEDGAVWFAGPGETGLVRRRAEGFAPQTRLVRAPEGVVGEPAVVIEFDGGHAATPNELLRFSHRVGTGDWSTPDSRRQAVLTDVPNGQEVVFEVRAVDRDGHVDPTPARASFHVDLTPPVAVIGSPAQGSVVRGLVEVRGDVHDATDFDRYRLELPGSESHESSRPVVNGLLAVWDTTRLSDGQHDLVLTVVDRQDGADDTVHTETRRLAVLVDNTLPEATLTVPPGPLSGRVTVAVRLADANLADYRLEYTQVATPTVADWRLIALDDVDPPSVGVPVPWDSSAVDGPAALRLRAFDAAGNVAVRIASVELENPSARPFVLLLEPEDGAILTGTVTVRATITDTTLENYTLELRSQGGGSQVLAEGDRPVDAGAIHLWETESVADGVYVLRLRAVDDNGYETVRTGEVLVDNTDPVLRILAPRAGRVYAGDAPLRIAARVDEDSPGAFVVEYAPTTAPDGWQPIAAGAIEEDGVVSVSWDPGGLDEGIRIRVTVTDEAGTEASGEVGSIQLDSSDPELRITDPEEDGLISGEFTVRGTVLDEHLAEYELAYADDADDSPAWRSIPVADPSEPVSDGLLAVWETPGEAQAVRLRVAAVDLVGHRAEETVRVRVDNSPPMVAVSNPYDGQQIGGVVDVDGTVSDPNFADYRVEWVHDQPWPPAVWNEIAGPVRSEVADGRLASWNTVDARGSVILRVVARDQADGETELLVPLTVVGPLGRADASQIESVDGRARLRIPPNALPGESLITVNPVPTEQVAGANVQAIYALSPDGLAFDPRKPATFEFRPTGVANESLGVYRWDRETQRWRWLGGTLGSDGWLRAPLAELGKVALADAVALPSGAEGLQLRCQPRAFSPNGGSLPPETTISFLLREPAQARVHVYNSAGRLARQLVDEPIRQGAQAFLWDGTDAQGRRLPNGLYVVRLIAEFADAQTLVLIWSQ